MTLRRKTLTVIGMTFLGLMVILYLVSRNILLDSYAELEEYDTRQDVGQVLSALSVERSELGAVAGDWSEWDDTYAFIEDANNEYIRSNLADRTFTGLRLNLMMFIDTSGRTVFGKAFDLNSEKEAPVPQGLQQHLSTGDLLISHPDTESSVTGLILLPDGPMLIASRPILTSEGEWPIRGTLIMGRYLDAVEIERLAAQTHLSLIMYQFTATGRYSDNTTGDITATATWLSDNTTVATIKTTGQANPGLAKGLVPGTANITASISMATITSLPAKLTVNPKEVDAVKVTPVNPSVAAGLNKQFSANATYSDNTTGDITATVAWLSSNTAVASVNATTGLAKGLAQGTANITATDPVSGKKDQTLLTVTAAVMDTVAVTPVTQTIAKGRTQQFRAMGTKSDGTPVEITASANWSSNNTAVATIKTTGQTNPGLASGLAQGTANITATDPVSGKFGSTTLTVKDATLDSIAIVEVAPSVVAGRPLQLHANGTYSDTTVLDVTNFVTWGSNNWAVAKINAVGLVTSYAQGTANITTTDVPSGKSASVILTVTEHVLDSVTVTPVDPSITFVSGNPPTQPFTATGIYSDGDTPIVTGAATWTSDNLPVATIQTTGDANPGLATTVAAGTTKIIAAFGGVSGNTTLTVLEDKVAPVVTLTSPVDGSIVSDKTVSVSGSVDDKNATTTVIVNDGAPIALTVSPTDGSFSQGVPLSLGENTVLVRAVDGVGNTGTSSTRKVTVNPNKPTVTITKPADGLLTNNPVIAISGNATGATTVTLRINTATRDVTVVGGGYSANVTLTDDGSNSITAYAYATGHAGDEDYRGTSGTRTVILDRTAPRITVDSPVPDSVVSTAKVNVAGIIDDPFVTFAFFVFNGVPQVIPVSGGSFSQEVSLVPAPFVNTVLVTATDAVGNPSSSGLIRVTLDNSKPTVKITSPRSGLFTNVAAVTVNGTVDDLTISTASLYVNGVFRETISVAPDGSFSRVVALNAGVTNTLEVKASDSATPPNTGTSGVINVTVDTTAPVLTVGLSEPTDSVTIIVSSNEALIGLPTVSINPTIVMTRVGVNQWVGTYGSESSPIAAGSYVVSVNGTDRAGNTATRTATFTKETISVNGVDPTTVQNASTTLQFETNGEVNDADISVTQTVQNPSGLVDHPEGATESAGIFVDINASAELRANLRQIYIRVDYNESELPAGTDEYSLKIYLWDVTLGDWRVVESSVVHPDENYIEAWTDHLSKYGVFGKAKPTPTPTPTGGVGGPAVVTVSVSGLSATTSLSVDSSGIVQAATQLKTSDAKASLDIAEGTKLLDAEGNALSSFSASEVTAPPAPPSDRAIVLAYDFGPSGARFEPAIKLTMSYDPAALPEGVSADELYITYWDGSQWVALASTVDTVTNTVSADVTHFTQFAVMGKLPVAPLPASFAVSGLSITPSEVKPGEQVTISAVVTNSGGSEGTYTVVFKINNVEKAREEVTLGAGASQTVSFTVAREGEGIYAVKVGDQTGQFAVVAPVVTSTVTTTVTNWALIWGIIGGVIVLGLLLWLVLRRRARQA
jgi:sensor domain CHASE-containing protein